MSSFPRTMKHQARLCQQPVVGRRKVSSLVSYSISDVFSCNSPGSEFIQVNGSVVPAPESSPLTLVKVVAIQQEDRTAR